MWNRKELKKNGKKNLKKNYWRIVGICLLIMFIANGMRVTSYVDNTVRHFVGNRIHLPSNAQIMNDWYMSFRRMNFPNDGEVIETFGEVYTPRKGAFAYVYNRITEEKSVVYGIVNAMDDIVLKDRLSQGLVILLGVLLLLMFLAFISNILRVGQHRFLLENRCYSQCRAGRLLFIWRVKRWKKTVLTTFKQSFFVFLWDLTIIGGLIKRYSYKMIPYILAENPDIDHRQAFSLSRQMMNGNKWKAFVLDLSFLGWEVLDIFTLGFLRYLWIAPYKETVYTELYVALRAVAKERSYAYADLLQDERLYIDTGLEEYPVEEHPLYNPNTKKWIKTDYHREYSVTSLILIFFSFAIIGWLWEVSLHLFGDGVFVNRGFFHGPWLPIYGTGGVLIIVLLKRFAENPLVTFLMSVLVCGVVEYFIGWFLWEFKQMYWWNYTGYFMNLHGRICAEGLLIFGLGGCVFIYLAAPFFDEVFKKIPKKIAVVVCVVLLTVFAVDTVYSMVHPNSGAGITDYDPHH